MAEIPVGVRVFPNSRSTQIRKNNSFLHYSPVEEPPIDYTLRHKPRKNPDYLVVSDAFRKDPSPDYTHEEDNLRNPPSRPRERRKKEDRRSTQVVQNVLVDSQRYSPPPNRLVKRRDTLKESEIVLDDLDSTLDFEEKISFQDAKQKMMNSNISFKPYAPSTEPLPDYSAVTATKPRSTAPSASTDRARSFAVQGQAAAIAPVLSETVIEDLKSISHGEDVTSVNEQRRKMVEDMFLKTQSLIADARLTYIPAFFLSKYDETMPQWKRELLARRASRETLMRYEENAWDEFSQWKRQYAPNIRLRPEYQFAMKPALY